MLDKEKICPLMSRAEEGFTAENPVLAYCKEGNCALWATGYTTEKIAISCCSFEFMAMKNAEGLYQV